MRGAVTVSAIALSIAAPLPSWAQSDAKDAEEIVIEGRAKEYYLQTAPSLSTKFPDDLRMIPQSIQILPEQLIKDQAAVEITDLYRNISSVSVFSYSGVTFRGFRQDEIRYDGLLGDPFSGFSVPLLFDIRQVEIIKGPSGALFGGGEPGGLINYVTRGAQEEFGATITGVAGNYELFGGRADITGALTEDGTVQARLGVAYEDTNTFRFNTDKEDLVVAADLAWAPEAGTRIEFKFDYIDQDFQGARLRGVPVDDDGNFITSRRFNTNEETDFQRLTAKVFSLSWQQQLTDNAALTLGGRYIDSEETQNYHENRGLFETEEGVQRVRREFRDQTRDVEQYTALAELVIDTEFASLDHKFLLGAEYFGRNNADFFLTSSDSRRAGQLPPNFIVPDLNLINPDYGNSNPSLFDPFVETDRTVSFDQWAFFIQDQVQVTEKLLVSLGGRFEGYNEKIDSVQTVIPLATVTPLQVEESDEALTVRTGLVYDVTDNASVYFNYSTGFTPQGAGSQDADGAQGGPFQPERGRLFEIGSKIDLLEDTIFLTVAAYQINKTNLIVPDPTPDAATGALATIGEARSRGIEVDVVGDITENWTFTFSYAFNETKILEGSDIITNSVGDEFANAPDHQLGFWTRYDILPIKSAVAFGGQYVSEQVSLSGQRVQPFAIFDALWTTEIDRYLLQVNLRNIFDKEYAESGFLSRTGHFPGEPRTVRVELSASF
ncbi:MAG: TonB-dependent siderophore receptor [Sphingomonadales bacterium]